MGCSIPSGAAAAVLPLIFLLQLAVPARLGAQSAWLPFAGEGSLSLTFQSLNYGGHFDETGARLESVGEIQSYYGIVQIECGLTDRLAVNARLPYIASRYPAHWMSQSRGHFGSTRRYRRTNRRCLSVDTGDYYGPSRTSSSRSEYNLLEGGLTVTPSSA